MRKGGELFIERRDTTNKAKLLIGNKANQRVPRVAWHLSLRLPTPFNDTLSDKTPN